MARFEITQRRYPERNWDYKAVSTRVNGREIVYYTLIENGKKSQGVETFQGFNYDPFSSARSYSRRYKMNKIPKKYKKIVDKLKEVHKKVKWSNNKHVDTSREMIL